MSYRYRVNVFYDKIWNLLSLILLLPTIPNFLKNIIEELNLASSSFFNGDLACIIFLYKKNHIWLAPCFLYKKGDLDVTIFFIQKTEICLGTILKKFWGPGLTPFFGKKLHFNQIVKINYRAGPDKSAQNLTYFDGVWDHNQ